MNILHISPYVPSVHASHAGGVCMGKELEALRKKHNVFVLSFINDEKEEKLVEKEFKNDIGECINIVVDAYSSSHSICCNQYESPCRNRCYEQCYDRTA